MRNAAPGVRAGGNILPSFFVKLSASADFTILQAGAGDRPCGVSQVGPRDPPGTPGASPYAGIAGDEVELFSVGDSCVPMLSQGGWKSGDLLMPNTNGASTATSGQWFGAQALSTVNNGEFGAVQVLSPAIAP